MLKKALDESTRANAGEIELVLNGDNVDFDITLYFPDDTTEEDMDEDSGASCSLQQVCTRRWLSCI